MLTRSAFARSQHFVKRTSQQRSTKTLQTETINKLTGSATPGATVAFIFLFSVADRLACLEKAFGRERQVILYVFIYIYMYKVGGAVLTAWPPIRRTVFMAVHGSVLVSSSEQTPVACIFSSTGMETGPAIPRLLQLAAWSPAV